MYTLTFKRKYKTYESAKAQILSLRRAGFVYYNGELVKYEDNTSVDQNF